MTSETKNRILYCGTNIEDYFIIIDKISDSTYKINICNKHVITVKHIYDVGQEFVKYLKIMINILYKDYNESNKTFFRCNKFDLLYNNLMLLDKTNIEECNKIFRYLPNNNLIICNSNLLDNYLHNKLVAKCNLKKNNFILTNYFLCQIKEEYNIKNII